MIGQIIAHRYRIDSLVGEGGFGDVYRATHLTMDHDVALKILHPNLRDDPRSVARFEREAKASCKLKHPNTISVFDFGATKGGDLFIAMEFLDGVPLSQLTGAKIEPPRALRIARQIVSALVEAHGMGVIHRDLKPDNIFLTEVAGDQDFVKVLDFGIARIGDSNAVNLTTTGTVMGSPTHMSPEQCYGKKADERSDLYAVGIILYEMLAGRPLFQADVPMGYLTKHASEKPDDLVMAAGASNPVPERLAVLVHRLLEKDPEDRFQTSEELLEAIDSCIQPSTTAEVRDGEVRVGATSPGASKAHPDFQGRVVAGIAMETTEVGRDKVARHGGPAVQSTQAVQRPSFESTMEHDATAIDARPVGHQAFDAELGHEETAIGQRAVPEPIGSPSDLTPVAGQKMLEEPGVPTAVDGTEPLGAARTPGHVSVKVAEALSRLRKKKPADIQERPTMRVSADQQEEATVVGSASYTDLVAPSTFKPPDDTMTGDGIPHLKPPKEGTAPKQAAPAADPTTSRRVWIPVAVGLALGLGGTLAFVLSGGGGGNGNGQAPVADSSPVKESSAAARKTSGAAAKTDPKRVDVTPVADDEAKPAKDDEAKPAADDEARPATDVEAPKVAEAAVEDPAEPAAPTPKTPQVVVHTFPPRVLLRYGDRELGPAPVKMPFIKNGRWTLSGRLDGFESLEFTVLAETPGHVMVVLKRGEGERIDETLLKPGPMSDITSKLRKLASEDRGAGAVPAKKTEPAKKKPKAKPAAKKPKKSGFKPH